MEKHKLEFADFLAGEFPIARDSGTAAAAIKEHEVVAETDSGIVPATKDTLEDIIGIAVNNANENGIVNFYMTGEFFYKALIPIENVTEAELKKALRKKSIFLKER